MRCAMMSTVLLLVIANSVGAQIDESELSLQVERAFPSLRIRRPVVIANAGDGSDRLFFVTQQGVIHVIPNDPLVEKTMTFLDIESRVVYKDKENEEGMLGLAFHPNYERNGEFFVYYTTADAPHTSVISRFRVSKDDPNRADPESEEELLRVKQPYWNHNGGALAFGPDGYLYIALGDGGAGNDPHGNGQNLATLLGSILRINVNQKDEDKNYSVPKDNPFVGNERARGEIWAYGLRNVWGMSFDRKTGQLWAADVGQNIWEEIDLITRGGNYGWNLREATHQFGDGISESRGDLIDPIWEYHHDVGKSITGGSVYRGKKLPELAGAYLYADYVSGRVWALRYNDVTKAVVANHSIPAKSMPVIAFGEDEEGEIYFTDSFGFIYQFGHANR
ncbi:MAG: PQQ-dependent sugar dehydrogenase [Planctomycetaceae bacterium]|nr:PQQ-dependent sugar dehydrogenase [Planctomycetales bacterium]MCB9921714.1 PQQ-dependent sugar dehydrogenase [Planctomycetaceae bacterium]